MSDWYRRTEGDGGFGTNKYELTRMRVSYVSIHDWRAETPYVKLLPNGLLHILRGFTWDGPSGPTHDDEWNMWASCLHDAGYYLIRKKYLPKKYRKTFDDRFYQILKRAIPADAPWYKRIALHTRAMYYYLAVRVAGGRHV